MSLDPRMTDELLLKYASNADKETVESEIRELTMASDLLTV
jgi:hypothetical protein